SGALPERWQFVALSKLCESFDYGTSAKSEPTGDVPVLRMGNIQNGQYYSTGRTALNWSAKQQSIVAKDRRSSQAISSE
ncbi:MAG: hypothetical protein ACREAB_17020, partial [Blastocatellia bacterium]